MRWLVCHIALDTHRCSFQIRNHIYPITKMHVCFGLSYAEPWNKTPRYGYWSHHQNSPFPVHCQFMVNKCDKKIINIPLNNIIFTILLYFIYHLEITPFYSPFCTWWLLCTARQMGFIHNILESPLLVPTWYTILI